MLFDASCRVELVAKEAAMPCSIRLASSCQGLPRGLVRFSVPRALHMGQDGAERGPPCAFWSQVKKKKKKKKKKPKRLSA